jgi:glucose-6-phosphate-specific signal transduction histidine kinase
MELGKWEGPVRGVALGVIFCLAYLAGRFHSLDQWFLPAGVRAAAFLLLPYRYWPYLLVGDCTAMLLLRIPRIPVDNGLWAYSSAVLMPLLSCLAVAGVREKLKTLPEQAKWLPLIAAFLAVWSASSTLAINNVFGGPRDGVTLEFFYVRCVGHFLAIIAIVSPAILWLSRRDATPKPQHFLRDTLLCGAGLILIFCAIVVPQKIGDYLRIGLMSMMLVPVIFMTLRHGWRGCALMLAAACFAVARTLYYLNTEGAYDQPVFLVQHIFVIACFGLLALGHAISTQYATARTLGISEKEAMLASRTSFGVSERVLREKALTLEQMQQRIEEGRKRVAEYLKAIGDFQGALRLNNESVEHNARFGAQIIDIYPLKLEQHGLNAVLNSQEFSDARGGGAHVLPLLGPHPTQLSLELQQVAYRCVVNAIDVLSELTPRAYVIKTRVRRTRQHRGIALIVTVRDPAPPQSTPKSANAAIELTARIKAHGGIVKRRHAYRISLWLPERNTPPAADQ